MKKPTKFQTIAGSALIVASVAAGGAAVATSGDDETGSDNYTPQQAKDATAAALDATGGGKANSIERDSENGATWEVEVTKTDGETVDVRLDEQYQVVVVESDVEEPGDSSDDD